MRLAYTCVVCLVAQIGTTLADEKTPNSQLVLPTQKGTCTSYESILSYATARARGKTPAEAVAAVNEGSIVPLCELHLRKLKLNNIAWANPVEIDNQRFFFMQVQIDAPDGTWRKEISYVAVPCGVDFTPCPNPSQTSGK